MKSNLWLKLVALLFMVTACSSHDSVRHAGLSGDDGVGGGIGGTGIVGVITEFGSIVVNGRHVEIAPNTLIRKDGGRVTADELQIGQVVEVQAVGGSDRSLSRVIEIRHEVTGPISEVDLDRGRIIVLDQAVVLAEGAVADFDLENGWAEGQMVSVSGFRLVDRTVAATRIDSLPSTTLAHLYGRYRVSGDQVLIDGVAIDGIAASSDLVGREIFVQGYWNDGELTPTQFEVQPEMPFSGLTNKLSIAGFFDSYTNTLSETSIERASDDLGQVKLSDGRDVLFGIFEGRWSSERVALEVDNQFSVSSPTDSPDRFNKSDEKGPGDIEDESSNDDTGANDESGSDGEDESGNEDRASDDKETSNSVSDTFGGVKDGVSDTIGGVKDGISDTVGGVKDGISDAIGGFRDRVSDGIGGIRDRIGRRR